MTLEQLRALTLFNLDALLTVLGRMRVQGLKVVNKEAEDWYDRLSSPEMPEREAIEAEFATYKQELIIAEEARLAEIARVEAFRSRWNAIEDVRGALQEAGMDLANPLMELERIIRENDLTAMALLEASGRTWSKAQEDEREVEDNIQRGRALSRICDRVYHYVLGANRKRKLDSQKGDLMEMLFEDILKALKNGRADKAAVMIQSVPVDGEIVTLKMKKHALKVLSDAAKL
jgi:hypothetical protein